MPEILGFTEPRLTYPLIYAASVSPTGKRRERDDPFLRIFDIADPYFHNSAHASALGCLVSRRLHARNLGTKCPRVS